MPEDWWHGNVWFPDRDDGYAIALCTCPQGPYIGARKSGTPCCCERCGFMTPDQFEFLRSEILKECPRDSLDVVAIEDPDFRPPWLDD